MKRYIKASTDNNMIKVLNDAGIDTTTAKYELKAETYERYGAGRRYLKKFTCPGDYLAYISMVLHTKPTEEEINDYFGSVQELVDEYPTVADIADHAAVNWWGDGDDYIIYLKNLTTGKMLYEGGDDEEVDEEDLDDDDEY